MKTLLILILCLAALVVCHRVTAGEIDLHLGAWSKHVGDDVKNSRHDLIGIRYNKIFIADYTNSHGDHSVIALYNIYRHDWQDFTARIGLGAVYGYGSCNGDEGDGKGIYCPAGAIELQYTRYRVKPSVSIMGRAVVLGFAVSL